MLKTAFYFIQSAMTRFTARIFPYQSRVSLKEAFEGLEPDEGKLSRPVLRGLGSRKAAWLLGYRSPIQDRIVTRCRETLGKLPGRAVMYVGAIHG